MSIFKQNIKKVKFQLAVCVLLFIMLHLLKWWCTDSPKGHLNLDIQQGRPLSLHWAIRDNAVARLMVGQGRKNFGRPTWMDDPRVMNLLRTITLISRTTSLSCFHGAPSYAGHAERETPFLLVRLWQRLPTVFTGSLHLLISGLSWCVWGLGRIPFNEPFTRDK